MAGTAHLDGHVRWPGKPTSGRYVYKGHYEWYWQCDLCGAYHHDYTTMQGAFKDCLEHSEDCTGEWDEEN